MVKTYKSSYRLRVIYQLIIYRGTSNVGFFSFRKFSQNISRHGVLICVLIKNDSVDNKMLYARHFHISRKTEIGFIMMFLYVKLRLLNLTIPTFLKIRHYNILLYKIFIIFTDTFCRLRFVEIIHLRFSFYFFCLVETLETFDYCPVFLGLHSVKPLFIKWN